MRRASALVLGLLALLWFPTAAKAQPVTSPGPDAVSVSIYRAPDRGPQSEMRLSWLQGYALITETRTVRIPAGRGMIRFEGVAAGILPESAIVTGLPTGVREKNLDADLLSPRSLFSRGLGRPVTLRRTREGRVSEEQAVIRSGPDGAAILQTREGFVAVDCGGRDTLIYDGVPPGLAAKPTLSIETESSREGQVTLTLSYLAWGFDWQANYVATMRPGGKSADLFAWVTLASGDSTSFADAETMVIAGKPNREHGGTRPDRVPTELVLQCVAYPQVVSSYPRAVGAPPPPPPPAPVAMMARAEAMDIVVTGARVTQEDLGDLKLYRVPHATTVAANSQKQVAMLERQAVPVDVLYRSRIYGDSVSTPSMVVRAQNRKEKGLGVPLPQGPVAVFEALGERRLLIGEGSIGDKAINEDVEVELSEATQLKAEVVEAESGDAWSEYRLTISNASPYSVRYEAEIATDDGDRIERPSARLGRKNGRSLWAVDVPANGTAALSYRVR